jgi:cation diffusion facilitator CzcD-associated flavoprotein CzcO
MYTLTGTSSDEDIRGEAKRWNILEKIRFRVECLGAEWSDDTRLWTVRLKNRLTGEEFLRKCRILISAVGVFNVPNDLDVSGLPLKQARLTAGVDLFKGEIFHSSQWRHDISLQGKKVIVIGNGCSATQLVPKIAVEAESVTQFIRSQHVCPVQRLQLIKVCPRTSKQALFGKI